RQDRVAKPREPITAKLVAPLLPPSFLSLFFPLSFPSFPFPFFFSLPFSPLFPFPLFSSLSLPFFFFFFSFFFFLPPPSFLPLFL
ncbi:hypothetical protein ACXWRS_10850, partial [Streptococcus pyogenes]